MCTEAEGTVEIVDVSLQYSGGLAVDDFSVSASEVDGTWRDADGDEIVVSDVDGHSLRETPGFEAASLVVDRACPSGQAPRNSTYDLGVQFSKSTRATARGANLIVTYQSGGETRQLTRKFELILCAVGTGVEDDVPRGECDYWPMDEYERHAG